MADPPRGRLRAGAVVRLAEPAAWLRRLCDELGEFGEAERRGAWGRIRIAFGTAVLTAGERTLALEAEAEDATALAFLKQALAERLLAPASGERPQLAWTGEGAGGGVPPYFREMRVADSRRLTPAMQRLTLRGTALARFAHGGLHARLLIPPRSRAPRWPSLGADGRPVWPEGEDAPTARVYTLRRVDPGRGEVLVDVVLHEGSEGPGATWARHARPGDLVGLAGPGGGDVGEAEDYLLLGDETALPAIARILERLPAGVRARVLLEVADAAERQELASAARLELDWLYRDGRPAGATTLLAEAAKALAPPVRPEGFFAWVGAEQAAAGAIRDHWRGAWGLDRRRHLAAAYWRREE